MAIPMIVGGVLAGLGAAAKGIASGVRSKKERLALEKQADQTNALITKLQDAVRDGKMDLDSMLGRVDAHMSNMGGKINEWYNNQMQIGTQLVQQQMGAAIDQIKFGINEAKIRADRSERDHLEQKEEQVKRLEKDFNRSNQEIANQAVKRRLGGSGAFMAAIGKSQETLGKVKNELEKTSSRALRAIGEQFSDVTRAAGFQTLQAQEQAGRSTLGLQAQLGGQRAQQEMALEQQGFGARESAFGRALTQTQNELALQQQAGGLRIRADATTGAPGVLDAIGGGLTGIGGSLMGAGGGSFGSGGRFRGRTPPNIGAGGLDITSFFQ